MKMKFSKLFIIFGVLLCIFAFYGCGEEAESTLQSSEITTAEATETPSETDETTAEVKETSSTAAETTSEAEETSAEPTETEAKTVDTSEIEETSVETEVTSAEVDETTEEISCETSEEMPEEIETTEEGLVIGTYYLPYVTRYCPTSLTFDKNGFYTHNYVNETENERGKYEIVDGKIILEADDGSRFYLYRLYDNRVVLEGFTSKKENLGGNLWSYGMPFVYFLQSVGVSEMLSATVMEYNDSETLPVIEKIYGEYDYKNNDHFNSFDQKAYAFMMSESDGGEPHSDRITSTDYTFTYADEREIMVYAEGELISLDVAYLSNIITEDDLLALLASHSDCNIAHSYNEGEIVQNLSGVEEILYTCTLCGTEETVSMPDDFTFTLTWSFDGYYDSETGYMENGYNYTQDTKCETTMHLTPHELLDIYRLFYNGELFDITEDFTASDILVEPSYLIKISYKINGKENSFKIDGASYGTYKDWEVHTEFGYAYEKIVKDYILSSEEYKSMPRNENAYD